MKHYLEIAKQYFQHLEGLQLYPSYRSFWLWAWVGSTAIWLGAMLHFLVAGQSSHGVSTYITILLPEALWIGVTLQISSLKERQLITATNQRLGTSFSSVSECRCHFLSSLMALQPLEFLKTAKEIDDLLSLQGKFRKHSDLTASDLARNIYDRESKARLLTLIVALVSITIALAIKSDATLETLFEVYSEPGSRNFFMFIAGMVALAFVAFIGLQIFVLSVVDALALWSIKLSRGSMFSGWLLSYLVRDLVQYHGFAALTSQMSQPLKATNERALALESNVAQIGTTHSSEMTVEQEAAA